MFPINKGQFFFLLSLISLFSAFWSHLMMNFPLTDTFQAAFRAVFEFIWATCVSFGHSSFTVVSYQQQGKKSQADILLAQCWNESPPICPLIYLFIYFRPLSLSLCISEAPRSSVSASVVYSVPLTLAVAWAQRVLLLVRWQVHRADMK